MSKTKFEKWYESIDPCDARKLLTKAAKKMPDSENKTLAEKWLRQPEFCYTLKRCTYNCVKKYL